MKVAVGQEETTALDARQRQADGNGVAGGAVCGAGDRAGGIQIGGAGPHAQVTLPAADEIILVAAVEVIELGCDVMLLLIV